MGMGDYYLKTIENVPDPVEIEQKQKPIAAEGEEAPKVTKHRTLK